MADGDIFLVSKTGDTINLNPLLTSDNGVQVVSGLTGFGLPSVEVMYQVGAGDGAKYRGQRALPRDIDLPLHIKGTSRANLRTHVNRLVRALADECRLQWDDGDRLWEIKVRRVGGGEYVMGSDTTLNEINLTITLRAEKPMWTAVTGSTVSQTFGTGADAPVQVTIPASNFGTVDSRPVVKVYGPTLGFTVENHDKSKSFRYNGFIAGGDWIEVNTETGRVVNKAGASMYANMGPAPQFFSIKPEQNTVWLTVDRSSASYTSQASKVAATNSIANPSFTTNTGSWTLWHNPAYTSTPSDVIAHDLARGAVQFKDKTYSAPPGYQFSELRYKVISAGWFDPGVRQQVEVHYEDMSGPGVMGTPVPAKAWVMQGGKEVAFGLSEPPGIAGQDGVIRFDFIPDAATDLYLYIKPATMAIASGNTMFRPQIGMWVTKVSMTEYGYNYFDGDTPDTATYNYAWAGAQHISSSTLFITQDKAQTKADLNVNAQNWMVV